MRRIKNYATSFGFDFHACVHYKERVPVDEICDHIPCRKLFQASDCSTYIDPAIILKLPNYLIHEKYIQFPFLHAVLCSDLSMI